MPLGAATVMRGGGLAGKANAEKAIASLFEILSIAGRSPPGLQFQ